MVEINDVSRFVEVKMNEQFLLGQEVVVSASRVEENILEVAGKY